MISVGGELRLLVGGLVGKEVVRVEGARVHCPSLPGVWNTSRRGRKDRME